MWSASVCAQEKVFFGNLHSHTDYSDGVKKPTNAYKHARDKAKIHFLLISEHNHSQAGEIAGDPTLYTGTSGGSNDQGLIPTAGRFTKENEFVALYGQEFSTISSGNHINVFDVPEVIDAGKGEFKRLIEWIEKSEHHDTSDQPALLQFNHPWSSSSPDSKEYGRDDFGSKAKWIEAMDKHAQLIEVVNGPAKTTSTGIKPAHVKPSHYLDYLNMGFHLAPTANQDNHRETWGDATQARTGVVTTALSKTAIMTALRARHAYATTDSNLKVIARVNGHLMGDIITDLPTPGDELTIELTLRDSDEGNAEYIIDVLSDNKAGGNEAQIAETFTTTGNTPAGQVEVLDGILYRGPDQYVLLAITQVDETDSADSDKAWTAPVWFEAAAAQPTTGRPRIVSLLPNGANDETQTEQATIKNTGSGPVSMIGWALRDPTKKTWKLDSLATLAPGQEKTITRSGQPMAMNNGGDTIFLVNPSGEEVQVVSYGRVAEGVIVTVND